MLNILKRFGFVDVDSVACRGPEGKTTKDRARGWETERKGTENNKRPQ